MSPQSATRNLQPATCNLQPTTCNPQPATHNLQPATRNPQPATCNPQPATRNCSLFDTMRVYTSPSWNKSIPGAHRSDVKRNMHAFNLFFYVYTYSKATCVHTYEHKIRKHPTLSSMNGSGPVQIHACTLAHAVSLCSCRFVCQVQTSSEDAACEWVILGGMYARACLRDIHQFVCTVYSVCVYSLAATLSTCMQLKKVSNEKLQSNMRFLMHTRYTTHQTRVRWYQNSSDCHYPHSTPRCSRLSRRPRLHPHPPLHRLHRLHRQVLLLRRPRQQHLRRHPGLNR